MVDCLSSAVGTASAADVVARRLAERGVALAAHRRRRAELAGPRVRPGGPVLPPRAAVPLRGLPPLRRGLRVGLAPLVPRLRPRRVADARHGTPARHPGTDPPPPPA